MDKIQKMFSRNKILLWQGITDIAVQNKAKYFPLSLTKSLFSYLRTSKRSYRMSKNTTISSKYCSCFLCKTVLVFLFYVVSCLYYPKCSAQSPGDLYDAQFENSGAAQILKKIPKPTLKILDNIGISGKKFQEFCNINPNKVFSEIISQGKNKFVIPLKCTLPILAVILLNALTQSVGISLGNKNLDNIISAVSCVAISITIIDPIVKCIASLSAVIKSASDFVICFVPVMSGIMFAMGQPVSASSYQIMMLGASKVVSNLCSDFLTPLMSTMLGIAVVSSISGRLKLNNLCNAMYKFIRWILWAATCIFSIMLTIQNLVSSGADNVSNKTVKLAFSSFVPIVGSALGDAYSTVHGCIKLLKSGVGALAIIVASAIFIPAIVECCAWMSMLTVCCCVSEIFALDGISSLLKSSNKVVQILLAIILSCTTALIASTVIILLIGGGN